MGQLIASVDKLLREVAMVSEKDEHIAEWVGKTIARINVSHLAKICKALDCKVVDIIEYVPYDKRYFSIRKGIILSYIRLNKI